METTFECHCFTKQFVELKWNPLYNYCHYLNRTDRDQMTPGWREQMLSWILIHFSMVN